MKSDTAHIVLDTNILQYGTHKELGDEMAMVLEHLSARKLECVLSSYSKFEIYRGLDRPKIPKIRAFVNTLLTRDVDDFTFRLAAALYSCYQYYPATKGKKYDDGDMIIGATAFYRDFSVLTANGNDFPRPFFEEQETYSLKRLRKSEIVVQLLRPNHQHLNRIIQDCLL